MKRLNSCDWNNFSQHVGPVMLGGGTEPQDSPDEPDELPDEDDDN